MYWTHWLISNLLKVSWILNFVVGPATILRTLFIVGVYPGIVSRFFSRCTLLLGFGFGVSYTRGSLSLCSISWRGYFNFWTWIFFSGLYDTNFDLWLVWNDNLVALIVDLISQPPYTDHHKFTGVGSAKMCVKAFHCEVVIAWLVKQFLCPLRCSLTSLPFHAPSNLRLSYCPPKFGIVFRPSHAWISCFSLGVHICPQFHMISTLPLANLIYFQFQLLSFFPFVLPSNLLAFHFYFQPTIRC